MKKFIFSIVMTLMLAFGVSAQNTVPVFRQSNFSMGVNGGVQTNLNDWNAPQGAVAGFTFNHQLTPVVGTTLEVGTGINNRRNWYSEASHICNGVVFDQLTAFLDGRINLMNAFGGYTGNARAFEVEPLIGVGYGHAFAHNADAVNTILGKAGVNFNFNLSDKLALNLMPAVIWNLRKPGILNSDYAVAQLTAGLTYNVSPYTCGVTERKVYTQAQWDALNAEVNALRAAQPAIVAVEKEVVEVVKTDTVYATTTPSEYVVAFNVNSSELPVYVPALDAVAKNVCANTMVYVTGYASEEGTADLNQALSQARANAVKSYLVNRGVAAKNIVVTGDGATDKFGTRPYNRVAVVTLK